MNEEMSELDQLRDENKLLRAALGRASDNFETVLANVVIDDDRINTYIYDIDTALEIKPSKDDDRWVPYTGDYEKEFYDIKLDDGSVLLMCWPNAGTFHTQMGRVIDGAVVAHIRPSEDEDC